MKIAVIGTGVMGRNHLRVLSSFPDISEIIAVDSNEENLNIAKKEYFISKCYTDYKDLIRNEKTDGVIVATPPVSHKEIAIDFLNTGHNVMVEKPISHSYTEAQEIIAAAEKAGTVFTVGHIERFNPVITKIKEFIDNKLLSNIYIINTQRVGPVPKRLLGNIEGVLIDLAVHDIDIIHYLGKGIIESVKSDVLKLKKQEIYAKALMRLDNGILASSEFSWISPRRMRIIEIYGDEGMILGDYYNQEVLFFENGDYEKYASEITEAFFGAGKITAGKIINYPLYKQEPLILELKNFINAIKGTEKVFIKPQEALICLEKVLTIQ
ncbi:MAG: Gfo/Idh/MocA family oxidoreductase [Ignavibacteriaceae bacterium]|nr:Gfo/Idh/MocA family oxidoreductase [Ignavibacteriaceae bacterium]